METNTNDRKDTLAKEIDAIQRSIDDCHRRMKEIKEEERDFVRQLDTLHYEEALLAYPAPPHSLVEVEYIDPFGKKHIAVSYLDYPKATAFGKPYRSAFRGVRPDGGMSSRPDWRFRPDQVVKVRPLEKKQK